MLRSYGCLPEAFPHLWSIHTSCVLLLHILHTQRTYTARLATDPQVSRSIDQAHVPKATNTVADNMRATSVISCLIAIAVSVSALGVEDVDVSTNHPSVEYYIEAC